MPRYFIRLSYKGTNYHGWQVQDNANTVQEELNKALGVLLRKTIDTIGAGRTDTGVHARKMLAHFDFDQELESKALSKLVHQLNSILPTDIAVQEVFRVEDNAHARFDATSRSYEYHIFHKKDPFLVEYAYFVSSLPDVDLMNEAALVLKEYTDFKCFSKSKTQVFTNNCTITNAEWRREGDNLVFYISANRFLRNMVRAIVGTLLKVGERKINIQQLRKIIEGKSRTEAGMSVPACGLYLTEIEYPYIKGGNNE